MGSRVKKMFCSMGNKKGITLIEVVVAELMLMIGVLGLLSLMPSAWRLSGQSDYLGRAAGILQRQLQAVEVEIMNPVIGVTPGTTTANVYSSGDSLGREGDVPFTLQTTRTALGANTWTLLVRVTWPTNPRGISESLIVSKQEYYR
jgi:Tfp pilus assembly protein PilV